MDDFNATLLREKIVFIDEKGGSATAEGHNVIRSNRILLKLEGEDGEEASYAEKVVVRAQNMHTTLRLASRVMQEFYRGGMLGGRRINWEDIWQSLQSTYEREYNPYNWGAIYMNGQPLFKTRQSTFVDIIEKCAQLTAENYDATIQVTQGALKSLGKQVQINHTTTVAAVFTDTEQHLRTGIILRKAGKDAAFNFTAANGEVRNRVVQALTSASALLEAINLRHLADGIEAKAETKKATQSELAQLRAALARIESLDKTITSFEEQYEVRYRPEKPAFLPPETKEK